MDDSYLPYLFILVPLAFVVFWLAIVKLISMFGWRAFVNDRMIHTEPPHDAKHFMMQSLTFMSGGLGNYKNCITIWVHRSGIYLRPMWLFRFGHPLIQIKWDDITNIEERSILFGKAYEIGFNKKLPIIRLYGNLGKELHALWHEKFGKNDHLSEGH